MSGLTCEFCEDPAVFSVRVRDPEGVIEHHVCAKHAQELEMPVGTYVLDDTAYPSFATLAAAVEASESPVLRL